ncbi:uncharacterized protein LOC135120484 [Zophobas morio]|uniref:uncharacterized protein LOC135120484 n=1 Tax=Zophobas morio TaxID=2755281 RepID=UPI0030832D4A
MQSSELFKQKELSIDSNKPTKELEWIIRTLFDLIDIDSSGVITLEKALTAYHNWDLPADYAQELLRECANENHVIEFSNFLKFFFEKEKKIKELFHRIDTENDGRLKTFELKIALEREGVCVTIEVQR